MTEHNQKTERVVFSSPEDASTPPEIVRIETSEAEKVLSSHLLPGRIYETVCCFKGGNGKGWINSAAVGVRYLPLRENSQGKATGVRDSAEGREHPGRVEESDRETPTPGYLFQFSLFCPGDTFTYLSRSDENRSDERGVFSGLKELSVNFIPASTTSLYIPAGLTGWNRPFYEEIPREEFRDTRYLFLRSSPLMVHLRLGRSGASVREDEIGIAQVIEFRGSADFILCDRILLGFRPPYRFPFFSRVDGTLVEMCIAASRLIAFYRDMQDKPQDMQDKPLEGKKPSGEHNLLAFQHLFSGAEHGLLKNSGYGKEKDGKDAELYRHLLYLYSIVEKTGCEEDKKNAETILRLVEAELGMA